jgi:hypothetical protein
MADNTKPFFWQVSTFWQASDILQALKLLTSLKTLASLKLVIRFSWHMLTYINKNHTNYSILFP